MNDVKLWLAHEGYGDRLRAVAEKSGVPVDARTATRALALSAGVRADEDEGDGPAKPYDMIGPVAVVPVMGPMFKASWVDAYGGCSTERCRARVLAAAQDRDVAAIFLLVDSGGGEVSGTDELAEAVSRAAAEKPVHAHADDGLMASAAYWVASQATRVTASKVSDVGSIGVVAQLADTSEAWRLFGVTIHTVATGPRKGLLARPEVTDETLAYVAELIAPVFEEFKQAVRRGRGIGIAEVRASADGSIFPAREAERRGLIDGVMGRDEAFGEVMKEAQKAEQSRRAAVRDKALRAQEERHALLGEVEASRRSTGRKEEDMDQIKAERAAERVGVAFRDVNVELSSLRTPQAEIARLIRSSPSAASDIEALLRRANERHVQIRIPDIAAIIGEESAPAAAPAAVDPPAATEPESPPAEAEEPTRPKGRRGART